MKKVAFVAVALQISILSLFAASTPNECTLCVGAVAILQNAPPSPLPLLLQIREDDFATVGASLDPLTPEQRKKVAVLVEYTVTNDSLDEIERHTKSIVEWARLHGPFDAIGISPLSVKPDTAGFAIKRLAVTAQGLNAARAIIASGKFREALASSGALPYVDVLLVDAADVATTSAWLAANDPSKKIYAVVAPQSPNTFYDLARALGDGAVRAYLTQATTEDLAALVNFNRALIGDYAFDSTARTNVLDVKGNRVEMPVLTFVRGEDLRTIIVPRGLADAATITSLASDLYTRPRQVDAAGDRETTDVGRKGGHFLIGVQPVKRPFLLTLDHTEKPEITKEAINVQTQRGISVEEIIRNHQSYRAYQETIQPRYIARNTTKL